MLAFKPNKKSSTTHRAEINSMASQTQTVVDKGKSNSLIIEGLLKFLRDMIQPIPPKFLTNSPQWNGRSTKNCIYSHNEINYRSSLSC